MSSDIPSAMSPAVQIHVPCALEESLNILVGCFGPSGDLADEDDESRVKYRVYDSIVANAEPVEIL